jgi:hypothetical protein
MKRRTLWVVGLAFVLVLAAQAYAQFTPEEVAEWPKWEEYLKTANIIGQEQLSGPGAVTNPWKLTLEKDNLKHLAIWKNAKGLMQGYVEGWDNEIAAYRIDQLLGLNMIPPTIERRFREDRGSLQLWADSMMSYDKYNHEKAKGKTKMPSYKVFWFDRAVYLMRAFDNLISNEDRHANNILLTNDWRIILIDHSRSFRTSKKFTEQLIYTEKHPEGPKLMKELPRAFVDKLKGLTLESIRGALGEYLTDEQIRATLKRRDLILKEIDRLVKLNGLENTIYEK